MPYEGFQWLTGVVFAMLIILVICIVLSYGAYSRGSLYFAKLKHGLNLFFVLLTICWYVQPLCSLTIFLEQMP